MSNMNSYFEAQDLRASHCERRLTPHKCQGTVTIGPNYICLECPICGIGGVSENDLIELELENARLDSR